MSKHYIPLPFDYKDAVKAACAIKWDAAQKRWYAETPEVARAAEALLRKLLQPKVQRFAEHFVKRHPAAVAAARANGAARLYEHMEISLAASAMGTGPAHLIETILAVQAHELCAGHVVEPP